MVPRTLLYLCLVLLCITAATGAGPKRKRRPATVSQDEDDSEESFATRSMKISLLHNLGQTEQRFIPRGDVSYRPLQLKGGVEKNVHKAKYHGKALGDDEIDALVALSRNNEMYTVKAVDADGNTLAMTSVRACLVVESKLQDAIRVHLDEKNNVRALSLLTAAVSCSDKEPTAKALLTEFTTRVHTVTPEPIDTPQLAGAVASAGLGTSIPTTDTAKKDSDGKDNPEEKGFLQKYWLYILIGFGVIQFMGGAGGEEAKGGKSK